MEQKLTELKVDIAEIKTDMKYIVIAARKMDDIKGKVNFHDWFCKVLIVCFSLASMAILFNNTYGAVKSVAGI